MRTGKTVGRFAPSPSGRMHLGNLWSCLLAWLAARSVSGERSEEHTSELQSR